MIPQDLRRSRQRVCKIFLAHISELAKSPALASASLQNLNVVPVRVLHEETSRTLIGPRRPFRQAFGHSCHTIGSHLSQNGGMSRQRSLPEITYSNGRPVVQPYDHKGKRKRIHLGTENTPKREITARYAQVIQALDDSYQLPYQWVKPWDQAEPARAAAAPARRTSNSWAVILEAVRDEEMAKQPTEKKKKVVNSSYLALVDRVPRLVKGTTPEALSAIPRSWHEQGYKRSTQLKYNQLMRKAIDHAIKAKLISGADRYELCKALIPITPTEPVKHREKVPDHRSMQVIFSDLTGYWADAAWLLLLTGARPEELFSATVDDLDVDEDDVWWIVPRDHKNLHRGQDRRIPLTGKAREIVERLVDDKAPEELILQGLDGRKLGHEGFAAKIKRVAARKKVKPFSAYQLRHLAITKVLKTGNLLQASKLAGHANVRVTTQVYAHALDEEAKAGAEALSAASVELADSVGRSKMWKAVEKHLKGEGDPRIAKPGENEDPADWQDEEQAY